MEIYRRYMEIIRKCRLFDGISEPDILLIFEILAPRPESHKKGNVIFSPSDMRDEFGIVLEGMVFGERVDFTGERSVAGAIKKGGVFGELLAGAHGRRPSITVFAAEESLVLLFSFDRLLGGAVRNSPGYDRLIKNMFLIISGQYFAQSDRLYYLSRKSLRMKISAYLTDAAAFAGHGEFSIPFNRDELASYLCAERSALSRELSKMRSDGLIDYRGKNFRLLKRLETD